MGPRDDRRHDLLPALAACLLEHGIAASSLKRLADAAGTSDRMLLYYFADRQDLLEATLSFLSGQIVAALDRAVAPGERLPFETLLDRCFAALADTAARPAIALWFELVSDAARGIAPQSDIAATIVDGYFAWAEAHLEEPAEARRFVATLEGLLLLEAVGRPAGPAAMPGV
jgi:AcrR family transcriptional regulator